jgi:predicted metal-dependent peptidase
MKITLSLVRQVLRDALGFDSFIAGFVQKIREDERCPSAAMSAEGTMLYNARFCREHVTCNEDLFSLVMHEVLHPLFCHFIYRAGEIENLAADAIINATISQAYASCSMGGKLG